MDVKPWCKMEKNIINDEAAKDPGMEQPQVFTEKDFEGHRAHTVFVGVHMPGGGRRHSHRRHKHHHKEDGEKPNQDPERPNSASMVMARRRRLSISDDGEIITPPAQRVQFILGEDVDDGTRESHPLFSEMEELVKEGDEFEWKETARWVKFEEDVEEGGNRWSKPHVATLSLHSLFELRSLLLNGTVMLDMEANCLEQIADLVCDNMVNAGTLPVSTREKVREALLRRHRHQHEREKRKENNMSRLPIIRSLAEIGRNHSSSKNLQQQAHPTKCATSSSHSLHATTSSPGLSDDIIPSSQTGLLSGSSKDHRGCYLAVPTGDISLTTLPTQVISGVGVTTWFHASAATSSGSSLTNSNVPATSRVLTVEEQQHQLQQLQHGTSGLLPSTSTNTSLTSNSLKHGNNSGHFLTVPSRNSSLNLSPGDDMVKSPSSISMQRNTSSSELQTGGEQQSNHRSNTHFMRKIPHGAEASNILVGEVDFLEKTLSAFIRLSQAAIMGDLTEVPVPTRFIFILLGPAGTHASFHEIGRAMATLMSDEIFHEVAYRARKRDHLLAGIDEFLDAVTVLPPGEWDPTIRIEPPAAIPSQEVRKRPPEKPKEEPDEEEEEQRIREESGLSRTGRLFGGLINDLKRKKPFYISDFKDALSLQCIASWIFLYFACLSPIITFGGLLGDATDNNMAAMESLVSGFVSGMGYGFFSGQPLTILGSTGPVLVFETIVHDFCLKAEWNYLSFRFWIGTWIAIICLILVAIDASALVCYITRFTEENFATLIAFIFIYKAVENVLSIGRKYPINEKPFYDCVCYPPTNTSDNSIPWSKFDKETCQNLNGTLYGKECGLPDYVPNVFLMSCILFIGTFVISVLLKEFKNALFFPSKVRQVISDFSVIIAIFLMSILDYVTGVATPKLEVPSDFNPTRSDRGWLVMPFNGNPFWSAFIAILPALLGTILIFMDQQITAVIVNRKENKLKKGCGYHLDLFVLAILIQICSLMGIPWFVAATVLSINHVNSLKLESECAAPGEKAQFLGVREQRVTHILIFLMIGCSVLLTPLLSNIPMPVLFGVFLYMGVSSLKGLQFFDRILIIFMPVKYQPDYMFLRQVPLKRVHIFTIIQFACLVVLWLIKSFTSTSILFPLMLVVMIGIRKSLDCLFTRRELKILDDIMPDMSKRDAAEDLHQLQDGDAEDPQHPSASSAHKKTGETIDLKTTSSGNIQIPLINGNIMNIPISSINITEEVNRTAIWRQLNDGNNTNLSQNITTNNNNNNNNNKRKKSNNPMDRKHVIMEISPTDDKRLSTMTEEDDETNPNEDNHNRNITITTQNSSQNLSNKQIKEFWSESKVNPKDAGNAAETTV